MSAHDTPPIHIESHLPKSWEQEQSFNDVLYEWTQKAPWLAISAAAHLLIFFILAAIPWSEFNKKPDKEINASLAPEQEEIFEEPEEEIEEVVEEEVVEEPVLQDAEVIEEVSEEVETSTEDFLESNLTGESFNDVIGIGGGAAAGKFGGRMGRAKQGLGGGKGIEQALKDGLDWLAAHQSPDGYWDTDGFSAYCGKIGSTTCGGPGNPTHDVGMTGLALLAFLGEGSTTNQGTYRDTVKKGIEWLMKQQDRDSGLIGERSSHDFIYDHAIASLALCETYVFAKNPLYKRAAQGAIDYIHTARNPYSAWRYDVPPVGENDTSVTGWMVLALTSAKEAGLTVDPAALEGALLWLDEVTDTATGRVGYDGLGVLSSRTKANEHFPPEKGEAMTAVGLLCRFFLHQDPSQVDVMNKHADVLARKLPEWDPEGFGTDMYYWYYGSYAMFQMGGERWKKWRTAMEKAVVDSQRHEGDEKGSWDPIGPWGYAGGRVYSTALMVLCLEVYFRYGRVLGSR